MRHPLAVAVLLAACGGSSDGPDLSTPAAAARCQVAAVHARSVDQWAQCIHPELRATFTAELTKKLARRPELWTEAEKRMAPLATVEAGAFTLEAMKAGQGSHGDSYAWFRFGEHEKTEVVRKDGRWYVIDPD